MVPAGKINWLDEELNVPASASTSTLVMIQLLLFVAVPLPACALVHPVASVAPVSRVVEHVSDEFWANVTPPFSWAW